MVQRKCLRPLPSSLSRRSCPETSSRPCKRKRKPLYSGRSLCTSTVAVSPLHYSHSIHTFSKNGELHPGSFTLVPGVFITCRATVSAGSSSIEDCVHNTRYTARRNPAGLCADFEERDAARPLVFGAVRACFRPESGSARSRHGIAHDQNFRASCNIMFESSIRPLLLDFSPTMRTHTTASVTHLLPPPIQCAIRV